MNQTYPPTVVSTLKDDDLIYISDSGSGMVRVVPASAIKPFIEDSINTMTGVKLVSGTYDKGTLTLKMSDNTEIVVAGWTDLTGINFKEDGAEVGSFTSVNFKGNAVQAVKNGDDLEVTINTAASAPTLALQFSGIYDTLQNLKDAIASPSNNQQAIVLQPSEKYYHGVGGAWVELAPVGSFHPNYLGAYDTVDDLKAAEPSPADESLAIVGTTAKKFYIYTSGDWEQVTHTDLPSLNARVTDAEGKITTLQSDVSSKISGVHIEDVDNNAFDNINHIQFDGATVSADGVTGSAKVTIGRSDTPSFDPAMFQSAVDHGYAADDQGIKSQSTTDGWWIFKDLKSVSSRPPESVDDLIVFRNTVAHNNPALKHAFVMAIGKDKQFENKVWFMYRDGTSWTPWFTEQGAAQDTIDRIQSEINSIKQGNQQIISEISNLQTAAGNIYAPTKDAFNKAVTALINEALKNYTPTKPGHGGDKPATTYPRFYAQFTNSIPSDFTSAVTSTNSEATLLRIPTDLMRIFISVENDNDEASKVKGFKFNDKQEMSLNHRDITVQGKKYRAFFTAGGFREKKIDIKVDFGQGI